MTPDIHTLWANYQKEHTLASLLALTDALGRPDIGQQGSTAWDDEQRWQNMSGWQRFIKGQWWDPKCWDTFTDRVQDTLEALVAQSS